MPHEFRTIEAFVLGLEQSAQSWDDEALKAWEAGNEVSTAYALGAGRVFKDLAQIVRTSNIGIVYPPNTVGMK